MIVNKIVNEQGNFEPEIPNYLKIKKAEYLPETDKYVVELTQESIEASRITPAQGRAQLNREGKLAQIAAYIEQGSDEELKIFWEYSTFWDRNTQTVKGLAEAFEIDLGAFWIAAKGINL